MGIEIISDLSSIIKENTNNNYGCFEVIKNDYGVYIFRCKTSGKILYVGEAKDQTLKERVKQNFTEKDTGGTFRDSYMEDNQCSFLDFATRLNNVELLAIKCPKSKIISVLEAVLIIVLNPEYNKNT